MAHPSLQTDYEQTPLPYEVNVGQTDPSVLALSHGSGFGFWLTDSSMVFSVPHHDAQSGALTGSDVFSLQMVGTSSQPRIVPGTQLTSWSSYFIGSDRGKWLPDVAQYTSLTDQNVYPGIDLALQSSSLGSREFEYDFVLHPGANLSEIQLDAEGLRNLSGDAQGRLVLGTSGGNVYMDSPVFQQTINGQLHDVAGSYVLGANGTVGFQVTGNYDPTQPLVLDPALNFATYLGGSGNDSGYAIAVDQNENSYITGTTASTNFPTANGYNLTLSGGSDFFVTKMMAGGEQIAYSTYIGGSSASSGGGLGGLGLSLPAQMGLAIAVNAAGEVVVAGNTTANDFPTTSGSYDPTGGSGIQTAILKLNATGDALDWSTYLGSADAPSGVAIDTTGVYVSGTVSSSGSIPTTVAALQTSQGGGSSDAWIAKLDSNGDSLVYASYLGGSGDEGYPNSTSFTAHGGIAIDSAGDAFVTGQTTSSNFPTTSGAYETSKIGTTDAFVSEVSPDGSSLVFSSYIGATGNTKGHGIAVDVNGQVYVTGETDATSFPTAGGAFQTSNGGLTDAFALSLDPTGSSLVYSTYLGGTYADYGYAIAVDNQGQATIVGQTSSSNFPTTSGTIQSSMYGSTAAFVARLTATGTLSYSSYLGSTSSMDFGSTEGYGLALDPRGDAYVTGSTNANSLVGASGGGQGSNAGGSDVFALEVLPDRPVAPVITGISSDTGASSTDGITSAQNLTIFGTAPVSTTVTLDLPGTGVLGNASVSSGGTWSYDYTAVTLSDGTYAFQATDFNSVGASSDRSNDYNAIVSSGGPSITVTVDPAATSLNPMVTIQASDALAGFPANATITLDVDLNNDGDFTDAGESGYATLNLGNAYGDKSGTVSLPLPTALPAAATYGIRARITDIAAVQGTSAAVTTTVTLSSVWPDPITVLTADPVQGDWTAQLGDVNFTHSLDLDRSPGTDQAGNPMLVYHSSQVSQKPIVQVQIAVPGTGSAPTSISATLTLYNANNSTPIATNTYTYSIPSNAPGNLLTLALQSSATLTTTARYDYEVQYTVVHSTTTLATATLDGTTFVVAEDNSALGAGWTYSGTDQLVSIPADTFHSNSYPAGELEVYGTGGWRFFQGTSTFSSPTGDNGTLTLASGTYTYQTPDGQSETFNSNGYETQATSADGNETLQYRYDGTNRLTGITAIDGGITTVSYSGTPTATITFQTVNSRTTTLTLASGNVTKITNPDGGIQTLTYDGNHRMTREQFGLLENNWAYSAAGVLGTYTAGATYVNSANPDPVTYSPANTVGLTTAWVGTVIASTNYPDLSVSSIQLDGQGRQLQVTGRERNTTKFNYSNGFMTSETDPLGRTTTYSLDSAGYTTLETLPDGSTITYQYQSAFHALTTMIDERGETTTYAYDSTGHQTSTTDALGHRTTTIYLSNGLVSSVSDAAGTTAYHYDSDRRLTAQTDALGNTTTSTYDSNGNENTITDALGRVTTYNYDMMDRLTGTTDALGDKTTTTFDASGLELTEKDKLGMLVSITYDYFKRGLIVKQVDDQGGINVTTNTTYDNLLEVSTTTDGLGNTTWYAYDGSGHVYLKWDKISDIADTEYDYAGQLTEEQDYDLTWTFNTYNLRGWLTQSNDGLGNVTSYAYDAAGNRTAVTDPLGHTTTYSYDALDRQTLVTVFTGTTIQLTTTSYDAVGNTSTVQNPNGTTTSYAYDADNRQTSVTILSGTVVLEQTTTTYDPVGNVATTIDAAGGVTTYQYDALNRQTAETDPAGNLTTTAYDTDGDVATVTDATGQVTTYLYDSMHRQTQVIDPLSNSTTMVLDADNHTVQTQDSSTNITTYLYDTRGDSTGTLDANKQLTRDVLYANGSPQEAIDPNGNVTTYELNPGDQVTETISPTGGITATVYDAAGHVSQVTDPDNRIITYSYDSANELIGETWMTVIGTVVSVVNVATYTYDNDGNVLTAQNYTGTETYTYDTLDRVSTYTNVWGQTLTYSYDNNNNVTLRQDSLGGTLTSTYNTADLLATLQFSGTDSTGAAVQVGFIYNKLNEQTTITWYSNLSTPPTAPTGTVVQAGYKYDTAGRLTTMTYKNNAGTTLSYYDYKYNANNLVTSQTYWSNVGGITYTATNTYSYDKNNQLVRDETSKYNFDGNGNRSSTYDLSGHTTQIYHTTIANEMTSDGTSSYSYDSIGNLTQKTTGAGTTWTYNYDNANQLTGVIEKISGVTQTLLTYSYDAEGHRAQEQVWTSTSGTMVTTRYASDPVDGGNVWADLDGSDDILVRYQYGPNFDQILTRTIPSSYTNAGVTAYLADKQGSVRDLVNWSGSVVDHLDYSGFGVLTRETSPSEGDQFKFGGYQFDATTSLYYVKDWWYDPSTGSWTQQVPEGDSNLYRYIGNDPTDAMDPLGFVAAVIPPVLPILPAITPRLLPPTTVTPVSVGKNGQFTWGVQFNLNFPSSPRGGLIIQRVQRQVMFFNGLNGIYLPNRDNPKLNVDYFEVWPVPPNSTRPSTKTWVTFISGDPNAYGNALTANGFAASDTVDDIFSSRPIDHGKNISGAVVMRADAWYINGDSTGPAGFTIDPNTGAGLIPSAKSSNAAVVGELKKLFQAAAKSGNLSQPVRHAAIATWDVNGVTTLSTVPGWGNAGANSIGPSTLTGLYSGVVPLFKSKVKFAFGADRPNWWQ